MLKDKKVVHYKWDVKSFIQLGARAVVTPVDHPTCSNNGPVFTSKVVRVGAWGEFETENTIYRPNKAVHQN